MISSQDWSAKRHVGIRMEKNRSIGNMDTASEIHILQKHRIRLHVNRSTSIAGPVCG
jgi:hypothetical protein